MKVKTIRKMNITTAQTPELRERRAMHPTAKHTTGFGQAAIVTIHAAST
eukprot:CAMPEP_0172913636 /NCGR_PEP_ID=MMETSP1075-20121228/190808_1 /TAXON_ID=2916 /ORGANISM="Ceratium fusus, Strain PA161109" /LENGTH=48 /DNA_ID= /DNA_START= /DNA_END= /DNA_ORIENTATION=